MKELSIEEKAKAYDRAFEIAKAWCKLDNNDLSNDDLETLFPELVESEDEKIRKSLIILLQHFCKGYRVPGLEFPVSYKDMLAWLENIPYTIDHEKREGFHLGYKAGLEKQGNSPIKWNKNTEGNKPQVNHSVLMKTTQGIAEGEWKGEYWEQYRWAGIVRDSDVLSWMELSDLDKQGEQKPTLRERYKNIAESEWFKKTHDGMSISNDEEPKWTDDDEKKELKKIEDENYDGEDYGIDSLFHAQRILEKTLGKVDGYQTDDGILSHKCAITTVKKLYEQKPAEWKQENVEELSEFENAMMHIGYSFFGKRGGLDPNDTSSVKVQAQYLLELAQKPAEWSEEDEKILKDILVDVKFEGYNNDMLANSYKKINWLKSLKEKFKIQTRQGISKEDEYSFMLISGLIRQDQDLSPENKNKLRLWLKSIIYQSRWKPSEEQMNALWDKISNDNLPNSEKEISQQVALTELYEQLKKLRGE